MSNLFRDIVSALSLLMIVGFAACGDDGCEGNQSSLPLAGFYSSQTKSAISIDSLTVYGIGAPGDSAIIRNAKGVKQVYLPFDIGAESSRFVIRYGQKYLADAGITDTITIEYGSRPFFHSKECGAMYVFDVKSYRVSDNLIDSIRIPNLVIDNANRENIKIFFRTKEVGEK